MVIIMDTREGNHIFCCSHQKNSGQQVSKDCANWTKTMGRGFFFGGCLSGCTM